MAYIHVTDREKWAAIQARGELAPPADLDLLTWSSDPNHVYVFSGVDPSDLEALSELRHAVAAGKNQVRETSMADEDLVVLIVDEDIPGVTWEECSGKKVDLSQGQVSQSVYDRIGEYRRTDASIPMTYIHVVSIEDP